MRRNRRKFTSEFKAQVAIAALRERETLQELSARFDVSDDPPMFRTVIALT